MKLLIQLQKDNKTYRVEKEVSSSTQLAFDAQALIEDLDRVANGLDTKYGSEVVVTVV